MSHSAWGVAYNHEIVEYTPLPLETVLPAGFVWFTKRPMRFEQALALSDLYRRPRAGNPWRGLAAFDRAGSLGTEQALAQNRMMAKLLEDAAEDRRLQAKRDEDYALWRYV